MPSILFWKVCSKPSCYLIKGQKKCFAQTKIFFSLYFWLENNWSKTTQKRSVLASEPRIQLPEKLLFSFQYKVLSAEGGKCAAYSSTHLQPNLLNNTSPRWMPSTEDKVRPLEDKFSRSKQNEAWIQPTCLSSSKAWIAIWTDLFLFTWVPRDSGPTLYQLRHLGEETRKEESWPLVPMKSVLPGLGDYLTILWPNC